MEDVRESGMKGIQVFRQKRHSFVMDYRTPKIKYNIDLRKH